MTEKKHLIALVDDDPKIRELTAKYFKEQGLNLVTAESGAALDEILNKNQIDIIILDIMMPDESGLSICQRYRVNNINIPIIMLTAKGDEVDRIIGLEMGADDYLPKPFNPRELLARVHAILRRQNTLTSNSKNKLVKFGSFQFDVENRTLSKEGKNIPITAGEFNLLKVFIDHSKQPLSRDQLMHLAKGRELDVFDRSIDVQISRLRRLIEENSNQPKYLQTKWGYGYVFNPDGVINN